MKMLVYAEGAKCQLNVESRKGRLAIDDIKLVKWLFSDCVILAIEEAGCSKQ